MKPTGKIIILAFPDTFVRMSDEWICRVLPLVGLGTREYIKAGHAALILIENATGKACYYDFGRYVTPRGQGRVRSKKTDVELDLPFEAAINQDGSLHNIEQFLLWLEANPDKTHGNGRLLASVCETIDFMKAEDYILKLQKLGSIPYGGFVQTGSNCSRFVTDTILAATQEKSIISALNFNKIFTPSTVGNVEKAASDKKIFHVENGKVYPFKGSAFKENLINYFDKKHCTAVSTSDPELPFLQKHPNAQKLAGIGSNAWFEVIKEVLPKGHFRIKRYNDLLLLDFDGVYYSDELDLSKVFEFTYDSHCSFCNVIQGRKNIQLSIVDTYEAYKKNENSLNYTSLGSIPKVSL